MDLEFITTHLLQIHKKNFVSAKVAVLKLVFNLSSKARYLILRAHLSKFSDISKRYLIF